MIKQVSSIIGTIYVYFLLLHFAVSHTSLVISNAEIPEERISDCRSWEFQCQNGLCIAKSFVCDGLLDCVDGSDETYNRCQNITCDEKYFQCHYGACINKIYQCDGFKQCVDGSDELAELCGETSHQLSRKNRAAVDSRSCAIPAPSTEKTVTFRCAHNASLVCNPINGLVSFWTIAEIECNSGYEREKQDGVEDTERASVCIKGKWTPKIDPCLKKCDKLNPVNVDLRCFRNGLYIQCNENTILLHGTTVRPTCKPSHRYSSGSPPGYLEITCDSEGKWDNALFSCIPECGIPYSNPKLLIKGGSKEKFGDSPWHVAIYNEKKILICGGTIISPNLVLSAAHCFEENESSPRNSNANNYEVVVGKVTRNYDAKDSLFQKIHRIKKLRYSNKGYFGAEDGYQADIIILVLEERINISSAVLPACIDWVALGDSIYPPDDTLGKVVGWGKDDNDRESDTLLTVDLPFMSHERCLQTVPTAFKQFVTFDKFCAGSENGSGGVLQGDSGGGLLFEKNNRYFLQGIVSIKDRTKTGIAAFTDIAEHVGWISKVSKEIEEELKKNSTEYQTTTTTTARATTKATTRNDAVKFPQNSGTTRKPATPPSPSSTAKPPPLKNPVSIALQNCKKYAEYRYVKQWQPAIANRAGYWRNITDCVKAVPLIVGGINVEPKEYPHMALIGFGVKFSEVEWGCGGSLISERFVLSAAHCGKTSVLGPPRWALLGDVILSKKDESKSAVYDIIKIYDHPQYVNTSFYYDISLFELNTTVKMGPWVRPACLHTSMTDVTTGKKASIIGWGKTGTIARTSDILLKASINIVDDKVCNIFLSANSNDRLIRGYDSNSMICAGDLIEGNDTCQGDNGGPLQILIPTEVCMWNIIGVTSFGPGICGNGEDPGVYTKVAYYLNWIQSVVWP